MKLEPNLIFYLIPKIVKVVPNYVVLLSYIFKSI